MAARKFFTAIAVAISMLLTAGGTAHADLVAVNPDGPATADFLAVSGTGTASGFWAVSGTGTASASGTAVSGTGAAGGTGANALSGTGTASGNGGLAASGTRDANAGTGAGVSGTATASGAADEIGCSATRNGPFGFQVILNGTGPLISVGYCEALQSRLFALYTGLGWPPCDGLHIGATRTEPLTGRQFVCTPIYFEPGDNDSALFLWLPQL